MSDQETSAGKVKNSAAADPLGLGTPATGGVTADPVNVQVSGKADEESLRRMEKKQSTRRLENLVAAAGGGGGGGSPTMGLGKKKSSLANLRMVRSEVCASGSNYLEGLGSQEQGAGGEQTTTIGGEGVAEDDKLLKKRSLYQQAAPLDEEEQRELAREIHYRRRIAETYSRPRASVNAFVSHPWFERFLFLVIVLSCISIATINVNSLKFLANTTRIIDDTFTLIFFVEMILKMIGLGIFVRCRGYFHSKWNWLDFFIVVLSMADFTAFYAGLPLGGALNELGGFNAARSARLLRPIRALSVLSSLRLVLESIVASLRRLLDVLLLTLCFTLFMSLIAGNYFQGTLRWRCKIPIIEWSNASNLAHVMSGMKNNNGSSGSSYSSPSGGGGSSGSSGGGSNNTTSPSYHPYPVLTFESYVPPDRIGLTSITLVETESWRAHLDYLNGAIPPLDSDSVGNIRLATGKGNWSGGVGNTTSADNTVGFQPDVEVPSEFFTLSFAELTALNFTPKVKWQEWGASPVCGWSMNATLFDDDVDSLNYERGGSTEAGIRISSRQEKENALIQRKFVVLKQQSLANAGIEGDGSGSSSAAAAADADADGDFALNPENFILNDRLFRVDVAQRKYDHPELQWGNDGQPWTNGSNMNNVAGSTPGQTPTTTATPTTWSPASRMLPLGSEELTHWDPELPGTVQVYSCPYGYQCMRSPNPEGGFITFDDFWSIFLSLYSVVALEDWTIIMYRTQQGNSWFTVFFFVVLICVGTFFVLNLVLIVVNASFSRALQLEKDRAKQAREEVERRQLLGRTNTALLRYAQDHIDDGKMEAEQQQAASPHLKTLESMMFEKESMSISDAGAPDATTLPPPASSKSLLKDEDLEEDEEGEPDADGQWSLLTTQDVRKASREFAQGAKTLRERQQSEKEFIRTQSEGQEILKNFTTEPRHALQWFRYYVHKYVTRKAWFVILSAIVVFANCIFLALVHHGMNQSLKDVIKIANYVFIAFFTLELLLKVIGEPLKVLVKDMMNVFDAFVVVISLMELFLAGSTSLSVFRSVRLFRLMYVSRSLRNTLTILISAFKSVTSILILMFLFIFLFAVLGMEIFAGSMCGMDTTSPARVNTSVCDSVPRDNFDNIFYGMSTIFIIIAGDGWRSIAVTGMEAKGKWTSVYFLAVYMFGGYLLLNLFVAVLLSSKAAVVAEKEEAKQKKIQARGGGDGGGDGDDDDDDDEDASLKAVWFGDRKRRNALIAPTSPTSPSGPTGDGVDITGRNSTEFNGRDERSEGGGQEMKSLSKPLNPTPPTSSLKFPTTTENNKKVSKEKKSVQIFAEDPPEEERKDERKSRGPRSAAKPEANENDDDDEAELLREVGLDYEEWDDADDPTTAQKLSLAATHGSDPWEMLGIQEEIIDRTEYVRRRKEEVEAAKHPLRRFAGAVVATKVFNGSVVLAIAFSMGTLALHNSTIPPDSTLIVVTRWFDLILAVFFFFEAILKLLSLGVRGKIKGNPDSLDGYFHNRWNIFDFSLMICFMIAAPLRMWGVSGTAETVASYFVLSRGLRPWSLVGRIPRLELIFRSLLCSLPHLRNAIILVGLVWLVFSILGTQLFMGKLYACSSGPLENQWGDLSYGAKGLWITNRTECLTLNHSWTTPNQNFDNLPNSMLTLFQTATIDTWNPIMHHVIDAVDFEHAPRALEWPLRGLFFVCYLTLMSFFMINFFVSVMVDSFFETKTAIEENVRHTLTNQSARILSKEQQEFAEFYRRTLMFVRPPLHVKMTHGSPRWYIRTLVRWPKFEWVVLALAFLQLLFSVLSYADQDQGWTEVQLWVDVGFTCLFWLVSLLKLITYGPSLFLKEKTNSVDVGINFLTSVGNIIFVLINCTENCGDVHATLKQHHYVLLQLSLSLRLFRVARLYRIIYLTTGLRILWDTLKVSAPNFISVFFLLFLYFYMSSLLAMKLFGRVRRSSDGTSSGFTAYSNFETFPLAMTTLLRVATVDSWNYVMWAAAKTEGGCDPHIDDCGRGWVANVFFVIFIVIGNWIMLNFFTAVLMEAFGKADREEMYAVQEVDVVRFKRVWKKYAGNDAAMSLKVLLTFLGELGEPLGPNFAPPPPQLKKLDAEKEAGTTAAVEKDEKEKEKDADQPPLKRRGSIFPTTEGEEKIDKEMAETPLTEGEEQERRHNFKPSPHKVMRFLARLDMPTFRGQVTQDAVFDALLRHYYGVTLPRRNEVALTVLLANRFETIEYAKKRFKADREAAKQAQYSEYQPPFGDGSGPTGAAASKKPKSSKLGRKRSATIMAKESMTEVGSMQRVVCAVMIQRIWRGARFRKVVLAAVQARLEEMRTESNLRPRSLTATREEENGHHTPSASSQHQHAPLNTSSGSQPSAENSHRPRSLTALKKQADEDDSL